LYVAALFLLDGVGRSATLNFFGQRSAEYFYFYWLSDVVLALGAFLLVCAFFYRACAREEKMWQILRLALVAVFVLVLGYSALSLTTRYTQLYTTTFIIEFSQNLYFTCLVLNTMLYVMMQQFAIDDDELGLFVCGLGMQFAGEAANLALYHLVSHDSFARHFFGFLNPLFTLGMLLIWIYAVVKLPRTVPVGSKAGEEIALLESMADKVV